MDGQAEGGAEHTGTEHTYSEKEEDREAHGLQVWGTSVVQE